MRQSHSFMSRFAGRWLVALALMVPVLAASQAVAQRAPRQPRTPVPAAVPASAPDAAPAAKDPFKDTYATYVPDFIRMLDTEGGYGGALQGWKADEDKMKLSSEPTFFTLNVLDQDDRANAYVTAALDQEAKGQYRDALKIYQIVIEKYPNQLYRVSRHGVFVPISQYCQRRILGFPPRELQFYRSLYDARAKEAYDQSRRQYSLIGLSEIVDTMLATSYGGRAIVELGNAALDAGYHLAALEYFTTVRDFFPDAALHTPELTLKIQQCQRMLGSPAAAASGPAIGKSELSPEQLAQLQKAVAATTVVKPPFFSQISSPPSLSSDDYTLLPPTTDPLALKPPVWQHELPGSRRDLYVFSQPVVTQNSVIYRHKNIVYCRSILNGELRWTNDLGGRAVWQNRNERLYPQEDVLVQDGLVFTTISKSGPSLVALDEVTGQIKWAYGPMVASNEEEARMRFEAAPTGGPRTIYAGYVLDNIEGETHIDSEYGLIAFDSVTGRLQWRTPLCRLAPGKFSGGFAEERRNRIRSFTSPPLYNEGTIYYNTNAGAMAAIDGQSGRIKWLARYPYYPEVHDATRQFGGVDDRYGNPAPHSPMFWYNQRPLLIGERLYMLPVDSRLMFCFDRRTGKVNWSKAKGTIYESPNGPRVSEGGAVYMLGPTRDGDLVMVYSGRSHPIQTVDPTTGEMIWQSGDIIMRDEQPVMKYDPHTYTWAAINTNGRWFNTAARPFLDTDDKLTVTSMALTNTGGYGLTIAWTYHLAEVSLRDRKVLNQRRFYTGEIAAVAEHYITNICPATLKALEDLPAKNADIKRQMSELKEIVADHPPENAYGPFMPFSRVTFSRYGVPFELRFGCREVNLLYDRAAVTKAIASRSDPAADFARAELAVADSRFDEAATLLKKCLTTIGSEDLDFRAAINQQLYRVHQRLARTAIRTGKIEDELDNGLGMSRTCSTLAEEIETLFALAEAYERKGDLNAAARCLRTIIETYGRHEYPISPLAALDGQQVLGAANQTLDRTSGFLGENIYGKELSRSLGLMKKGLPLYLSTVSPLPKTLTLRAGERAAWQLARLQKTSSQFAGDFEKTATTELDGKTEPEQLQRMWEFPGTTAAQKTLEALCESSGKLDPVLARQRLWRLSDAARVGNLKLPEKFAAKLTTPDFDKLTVTIPQTAKPYDFADADGASRLILQRGDDQTKYPELMFVGGRVRKRVDNKFILTCMDLKTGTKKWETIDIRLKGSGQEAGFYEAFVLGERVIVHGLYDVLAFNVADGKAIWSYRVPFDFEIKNALLSGDLLMLAGKTETLALYLPTENPNGEVAWQVGEMGDLYIMPYMRNDRLISVRKLPYSVTVRYRSTGQLIGRLDLPDLSMHMAHPLIEGGPEELPAAHCDNLLAVTDGWYYVVVDTDKLAISWKRLIDSNDVTREPAMRLALSNDYLCVLKEDYDQKAIYMLSAKTGEVLWNS
ncbi:MAG: PQQ-binding-like beta-propeller repeat protein, partial [Phycisphaerae bacterium]|nr:PQQ-binding-like beta-propeller repeat protein [Phycisphaerae bacterium]